MLLRDAWRSGDRDRELALHLSFLAWYLVVEPPHLTGLDPATRSRELIEMFEAVHSLLLPEGAATDDAEALYVLGLVGHMFPWIFVADDADDAAVVEHRWATRAAEYRRRFGELRPNGIDPATFEGRGAYGDYFSRQSRVVGGY